VIALHVKLAAAEAANSTTVTDKTVSGAVDLEKGGRTAVQQLHDARDNVSPFHRLGDQLDGRPASQQLNKSNEHQSGGGSGDW